MTNLTHNFLYMFISILYTFFEQPRAHHQENQLYQYDIWYMSLCVCDRLVCKSGRKFLPDIHTQSDTYQISYWYNWFSWWWARGCSKHVENWNKHVEKELCVKLLIYKIHAIYYVYSGFQHIIQLTLSKEKLFWTSQESSVTRSLKTQNIKIMNFKRIMGVRKNYGCWFWKPAEDPYAKYRVV
jgi:hypothetical protein